MKNRQLVHRLSAGLLASFMLTGCVAAEVNLTLVKPGETISDSSKWINSDIEGAIDENTAVNLKDDFYTAVNRDWILENVATEEEPQIDFFTTGTETLENRKKDIILKEKAPMQLEVFTQEQYDHNYDLIQTFGELAGDWDRRNELGVDPIRPYVEAIENIQTLDEMTSYILDANNMNYSAVSLLDFSLIRTKKDPNTYTLSITPRLTSALRSLGDYQEISTAGYIYKEKTDVQVEYLLGRLGYSKQEIHKILTDAYRYEARISDAVNFCIYDPDDEEASLYTLDRLSEEAGNYPIAAQLESMGLHEEDIYHVTVPEFLSRLDHLYSEKYLEEMKACWLVNTINRMLPYLDWESYEKSVEIEKLLTPPENSADSDEPTGQNPDQDSEEDKTLEEILLAEVTSHLCGPLEQLYVAQYCSEQQKQDVVAIVDASVDYYAEMIQEADWLSEEARNATVEKLEYMKINAVYPNEFVDYNGLTFDDSENTTIIDAIKNINSFETDLALAMAGQPATRDFWDLSIIPTSVCNAYYLPEENSVNILHGILLDEIYDVDMSPEEKLGTIGVIIGHEITHAFDTAGYRFDKNGKENEWWSLSDREQFQTRSYELIKYYSSITPYPGGDLYNGSSVSGEAIADMGGMKCMLGIAKNIPDFDYQKFFISFAELWRANRTLETEKGYASGDEHPLAFLRTNVTVQQFDEFHEAFDVQPGDGMYLDPEQRISVW